MTRGVARDSVPSPGAHSMLFDSHCHLTAERLRDDLDGVLRRAAAHDVGGIVTVASTPDDAEACVEIAREHEAVWATAGFHPHEASAAGPGWRDRVRALLARPEVVAVGECGLDYHYDNAPRAKQRTVFDGHLELAAETGLPLVVHSRSADADTGAALKTAPPGVRGVLHCFTGSDALLDVALELGFYVSFTGIITFRGFEGAAQVRRVPRDRIMVETDAPYLAPEPFRGKRNEPAYLPHIAATVAAIRDDAVQDVNRYTTLNADRFYALDVDRSTVARASR